MKPFPLFRSDVERLVSHLGGAELPYVDIQSQEAGRHALAQWALLARLRPHLSPAPVPVPEAKERGT